MVNMIHSDTISHYYAISQAGKSHYYAIALRHGVNYKNLMKKSDIKKAIAERQRGAIKKIMAELDLETTAWCRKAGVSEGSLRNFLNKTDEVKGSDSLQSNTLELLANAAGIPIGKLLGEESESDSKEAIIYVLKEILDILVHKRHATDRQIEDDFIYGRVQFGLKGLPNAMYVIDHLLAHIRGESPPERLHNTAPLLSLSPPRLVKG